MENEEETIYQKEGIDYYFPMKSYKQTKTKREEEYIFISPGEVEDH
jgi:hypothetical protein